MEFKISMLPGFPMMLIYVCSSRTVQILTKGLPSGYPLIVNLGIKIYQSFSEPG